MSAPARLNGGFVFSDWGGSRRRCVIRWFKHLSESADDEKLADILTELGPEGYGVWWLMVEAVAKQMDGSEKCEASYPIDIWARKLYISKRKTTSFLTVFSEKNLIFLEYDSTSTIGKIIVKIPNLLKFRDEYSKKSGQTPSNTPDKSRTKKQRQRHNQKKHTSQSVLDFFEDLWNVYPKKDGKKTALRHYLATVKSDGDMDNINRALGNYLDHIKDTDLQYVKNGSTWFNNWQDWVPEAEDGEE